MTAPPLRSTLRDSVTVPAASPRSLAARLVAVATLTVVFWLSYWHVTRDYWRADDPDHLTTVRSLGLSGLWQLFAVEDTWARVSRANFCPINVAIYGVWDQVFGPHPKPAYVHHLLNLFLLALAYFAWLLRHVRLPVALGFTALCFASLPVYELANELMSDHYALGALFAMLALYAFDEAPRRGWPFWLAGALLAALAALSKEIFGFVVLYPLLREMLAAPPLWRDLPALRHRLGPPLVALLPMIGFALWRRAMLGNHVGGYGLFTHGQLGNALRYVFGDHVGLAALGAVGVLVTLGLVRGWRVVLAAVLLALYAAIPSLFIQTMAAGRYWFLPVLSLCIFLALAWPTDFRRPLRTVTAVVSILLVAGPLALHNWQRIPEVHRLGLELDRQMRGLVERLHREPVSIEITDGANAFVIRHADLLCEFENPSNPDSCRGTLALGGLDLERFRDPQGLRDACAVLPARGWTCRAEESFTIQGSYRQEILSWGFSPCPLGKATAVFAKKRFKTGDWHILDFPCRMPYLLQYDLGWLDLLVMLDAPNGEKIVTPLFRVDMTRPEFEIKTGAVRIVPNPGGAPR